MKNILYKGQHSPEALKAFLQSMDQGDLFLFLPPTLTDYSFAQFLPERETLKAGDLWKEHDILPRAKGDFDDPIPCCGVFSSGTTRSSKLILYSRENIESSVRGIYDLFDSELYDSIFCYPQPYHTFGLTLGYGAQLFLNKKVIFSDGPYGNHSHDAWIQTSSRKITLGTPTHFYDLISYVKQHPTSFEPSYGSIIGGAKVKRDLWVQSKKDLKIEAPSIGYGATEASPGISHLPPGKEPQVDGEIGSPLGYVEYKISDEGLTFKGPNLCTAILEDGSLIRPKEWTLPDLIDVNEKEDRWVYQSRLHWFLNRGGEKFSLEKIEKLLHSNLNLESVACTLPHERLGEELGLLIKRNNKFSVEEVYSLLSEKLGRNFERFFLVVDEFPLNNNLKVDRKAASQLFKRQNQ